LVGAKHMHPFVLKALYLVGGSGVAVGGAVATGVVPASFITGLWSSPKQEVARLVENVPAAPAVKPIVKAAPKEDVPDVRSAKPKPDNKQAVTKNEPPKFDILRLEKDGSLLVAGNAAPNSKVELLDRNGTVLGSTKAGPAGDFVILPNKQLAPGGYSLSLRATPPSGDALLSKQAGVLNVPKPGENTALAMVSEAGAPSRVITKPKVVAVKEVQKPKVPESQKVEAKPDPLLETKPKLVVETKEPAAKEPSPIVVAKVPEPKKPEPFVAKPSAPKVVVEAVQVEGPKVFVAGEAKRGALVRVYINNEPVGSARGTVDNRFLVIRNYQLKAGKHSVRADLVSSSSGKVLSRAEVPLEHKVETPAVKVSTAKSDNETKSVPKEPVQVAKAPRQEDQPDTVVSDAVAPVNKPIRTGSAVIIKPGDNLWRISRRTYGEGIRYTTIYNANRDQIRDPSRIYIGQIFKIPEADAAKSN